MKLEFTEQIFGKKAKISHFHENPFTGNRVQCRRTHTTKLHVILVVAFRNFVNAPKGICCAYHCVNF